MNFRKGILALAAAGLGVTGIANAQYTCTTAAPAGGTSLVRVEGTTELLPDLNISGCTAGPTLSSYSISVTATGGISNTNVSGQNYTDATATFFGGTAVNGTLNGNTLTFTATTTGATLASGIVIHGVRVNASTVPANTTITETATATGIILSSAAGMATAVAYTQPGMGKPVVQGFANKAICSAGTAVVPMLQAAIISGYNGSFMPEGTGSDLFITVTFGNLASGANYYAPVSITGAGATNNVGTASLFSSVSSSGPVAGGTIGPSSGPQVSGVAQLTLTNGSATALYHLTGAAAGAEGFVVPLYGVVTSGATVGVTSAPTVTASFTSPASGYDMFSSSQTQASVAASSSATAPTGLTFPTTVGGITVTTGSGELTSCATTLLFPYIANVAGYDTGIALTNASSGSTAQNGTCSVAFFGSGAPTSAYTTATVNSGNIVAFTLSSAAPGFQGFAVATCAFQDAHGFAFITDGFGGGGRGLSQGYLAIITSAGGMSVTTSPF